jgi:hypothetical protein
VVLDASLAHPFVLLANDLRISCRLSSPRPHQPMLPLPGRTGGRARPERRPPPGLSGCMRGLGGARGGTARLTARPHVVDPVLCILKLIQEALLSGPAGVAYCRAIDFPARSL